LDTMFRKKVSSFFLVYQQLTNAYLLPSPGDFVRLRRFSWTYAIGHARAYFQKNYTRQNHY
jgi:hypothetical protein